MRFFTLLSAFTASLALVQAQTGDLDDNAITDPVAGSKLTAGEPYTIKWVNPEGSSVTIDIVSGPGKNVFEVATIVSDAPNTGSYVWNVPESIAQSDDYAIRIRYNDDPEDWNYSDRFVLSNPANTVSVRPPSATATPSATTSDEESSTTEESSTETSESSTEEETSTEVTTTNTPTTRATTTRNRTTASETDDASPTDDDASPSETSPSAGFKTFSAGSSMGLIVASVLGCVAFLAGGVVVAL